MNHETTHYFTHEADQLFALFFDKEFIQKKTDSLGYKDLELIECHFADGKGTLKFSRYAQPSQDIPKALRRFAKEWNKVTQTEYWEEKPDGSKYCRYEADIEGIPVSVEGTMHITPSSDGCQNHITIKTSCSLPLIGGKAATMIGEDAKKQMEGEHILTKNELKARHS